jgi:hypothetical protein
VSTNSISTIKKMPVVLGEVDVLKSILLLLELPMLSEGASDLMYGAVEQTRT